MGNVNLRIYCRKTKHITKKVQYVPSGADTLEKQIQSCSLHRQRSRCQIQRFRFQSQSHIRKSLETTNLTAFEQLFYTKWSPFSKQAVDGGAARI